MGILAHLDGSTRTAGSAKPLDVALVDSGGNQLSTLPGSMADGADVNAGATTDAAVTGDNSGTLSAKLRGLSRMIASVWDSVNNRLKVNVENASLTVAASLSAPVFATLTPNTTGGWSVNSQTGLTNTKVAVKASAGTFGGYMVYNPNSAQIYIQVFDVASGSVTLGTTTPTYVIPIPATSGANVEFTNGINHATAITLAATTTATGSTAPGTALTGFFLYK